MEQWLGKVAIVTGASNGIGADIAEALVRTGINVVGVARRVERIRNLAAKLKGQKGILHPMKCDVRKEDDILRVFEWTEKEFGGVDILVNNAGVFVPGPIIDSSTEDYRYVMDVNVIAVAICTREAVRSMRRRNARGHIININSIAGHNAESVMVPANLYCASKYAVTAMSQSVIHELAAAKMSVKVTSISPGPVRTEMFVRTGVRIEALNRVPILTGKDIADAAIYALGTPPNVQVKELTVSTLATMSSLFDSPVTTKSMVQ